MALTRRALLGGLAALGSCSAPPADDCPGGFAGRPGCSPRPLDPRGTTRWEGAGCPPTSALPSIMWLPEAPLPFSGEGEVVVVGDELFAYAAPSFRALPPSATGWRPLAVGNDRRNAALVSWTAAPGDVRIFRIGGEPFVGSDETAVDVYDPRKDAWIAWPPLPAPRTGASAFVVGSKLFVAGGAGPLDINERSATATVFSYNLALGPGGFWSELPSMPEPRAFASAVVLGEFVYLLGGATHWIDRHPTLAYPVLVYDRVSGRWSSAPPPPSVRAKARAVEVCERILLVGGQGEGGVQLASVDLFLPSERRWIEAPWLAMPSARSGPGVALRQGRLLCVGGLADNLNPGLLEGEISWWLP